MSQSKFTFACAAVVAAALIACTPTDSTVPSVEATGDASRPSASPPPSVQPVRRGFVWSADSGLQVIPMPAAATSMDVTDMNDAGQVAGYVTLGEGTEQYRAFSWSASRGYVPLGSLVGPNGISMAFSVNQDGDVTGLSDGPHSDLYGGPMGIRLEDAFTWNDNTGMKAIPLPSGDRDYAPVAAGGKLRLPAGDDCLTLVTANSTRQAIGYAGAMGRNGCHYSYALLWEADGTFTTIAECGPRAWCGTSLTAINKSGEVVGYAESVGFRWTKSGGMTRLPIPNASVSVINDKGDAAGSAHVGDIDVPIVWFASGEVKILPMPGGATYGFSVRINNNATVVGSFK